jgi:hypothetical protein
VANVKDAPVISEMSQPRRASRKKSVFLINSADDYRIVIFGKTNFRWFATRDVLAHRQRRTWLLQKSRRSVAAARSATDCGISTSANPSLRGRPPAGLRYHYKIVMNGKKIFWVCSRGQ